MRENLYKAISVKTGDWVFGAYIIRRYDMMGVTEHYIVNFDSCDKWYGNWEKVYPETVCQYIGIGDKNGVKIFDGDKLSDKYGDTVIVKFGCDYGVRGFFGVGPDEDVEEYGLTVIGNIHDKEVQQ